MKTAFLVQIKGIVTGVGFRYYTNREARKYPNLEGYVRNIKEGHVEVLVQGNETHVLDFIEWLKEGPSHARVDDIKINPIPISQSLTSFTVRY